MLVGDSFGLLWLHFFSAERTEVDDDSALGVFTAEKHGLDSFGIRFKIHNQNSAQTLPISRIKALFQSLTALFVFLGAHTRTPTLVSLRITRPGHSLIPFRIASFIAAAFGSILTS